MTVFLDYARYYDLLYQDKDYASEQRYIQGLINNELGDIATVLDLGCGTGSHAECFAKQGVHVDGVDISENMLNLAREKQALLPAATAKNLNYIQADVRSLELNNRYDVVMSLFHVASYQTEDDDIKSYLASASKHCSEKGLFLFDFWYGPAVVKDPPTNRNKTIPVEKGYLLRETRAQMDETNNTIMVDFTLQHFIDNKPQGDAISEQHHMRYFFTEELSSFLNQAGMQLNACYRWLTTEPASDDAWYAIAIASMA